MSISVSLSEGSLYSMKICTGHPSQTASSVVNSLRCTAFADVSGRLLPYGVVIGVVPELPKWSVSPL